MKTAVQYAGGNSLVSADEAAQRSCALARHLCANGDYAQAAAALADLWAGVGAEPELVLLSAAAQGEVLLVAGMVAGHLTKAQQQSGGQEYAKDLLSRALRQFTTLGAEALVCDAQVVLAACYLREHAFDDARLILQDTLEQPACLTDELLRLRVLLGLAKAEAAAGNHAAALALYEQNEHLVAASDKLHQGNFYNDYGAALLALHEPTTQLDYRSRAAEAFRRAADCFVAADHPRYAAVVENNRALLLLKTGQGGEAHAALDRAEQVLRDCFDASTLAQVQETRAQVLLVQKQHDAAIAAAACAVTTLAAGDEYGLLAQALTTHATALARAGRYTEAVSEFARAQALADERIGGGAGERIALQMVDELAAGVYVQAGFDFDTAVHRFEEQLIRYTLAATAGRVSEAALRLRLKHQTLTWMLNTRHARLLSERTEIKKRKQSLIKRPGKLLRYKKKK